jgi:YesN/AraC family two-component response regulator
MQKNPIVVFGEKDSQDLYLTLFPAGESVISHICKQPVDFSERSEVDMVLLDCGFDPETGLSLLKTIKSSKPHTPVIFLTHVSSEGTAIKAFRLGAIDYFRKPVNVLALRDFIENLLTVKRSKKERRKKIDCGEQEAVVPALTSDRPAPILRAVRLIEDNLSSTLPLKALANEANYSAYHFCRLFKKHMGMSPKKFVAFRRIERAKDLLMRREDMNISMVAGEVGFNETSNFDRNFRKFTGVMPSAFRKMHKDKFSS